MDDSNNILKMRPPIWDGKSDFNLWHEFLNEPLRIPDGDVTMEEILTQLQVPQPRKALNGTAKASRVAFANEIQEYKEKNEGENPLRNELEKLIKNPTLIDFILFCEEYPDIADDFLTCEFERFLRIIQRKAVSN